MTTKILSCRNLEQEVRLAMEKCGCGFPLEVLRENNHDVPRLLRRNIQNKLDAMTDADCVLMAFTTCGGAMVGLRTGDYRLVIPRVDDCLSLLMGSMERRKAALEGGFGIFLTKSWLDHENSPEAELARICSTYSPARAERIVEAMYGKFDSLNVIDTGTYDLQTILPRTEALAQRLKLKHRIVSGTTAYLEALLQGTHDPERFIVIPPHTKITEEHTLLRP